MTIEIFTFAIAFGKRILTELLHWWEEIYRATGMTSLWIGVVALGAVFSILIIPLRGGVDLAHGALGSFLMNRVNRHKSHDE